MQGGLSWGYKGPLFMHVTGVPPILEAMELILICKQCGHEEVGETERLLMAKIKMWNHLNRRHPDLTDAFKQAVAEETPAARRAAA